MNAQCGIQTNEPAFDYIRKLAANSFFGTIVLKFERGRIVHLRKEENLKIEELSGTPRSHASTGHV